MILLRLPMNRVLTISEPFGTLWVEPPTILKSILRLIRLFHWISFNPPRAGGLDEAHNLITPHTWAAPTTFAGPPKLQSTMSRDAKYCHVIVHRMEGENLGEFGSGFNNSGYWMGQAFYFSSGTSEHPIFPALRRDAEEFAEDASDARRLLRNMGPKWEPKLFNNFCEDALLHEDPELMEFCKKVQTRELQLLYEHIMTQNSEKEMLTL